MPFSYHPPTRTRCEVCRSLNGNLKPIIHNHKGKASAADNFPFHNWYNFVLGYTPEYPDYILDRERTSSDQFVVDPFLGSGTTMICCKMKGIPSGGVEANDFFSFASDVKLNWNIDLEQIRKDYASILKKIIRRFSEFRWSSVKKSQNQISFLKNGTRDTDVFANKNRPELLLEKYLSNQPFVKLYLIKQELFKHQRKNDNIKNFFLLGLTSIVLPVSNVRYGPGFGIIKPKIDVDVLSLFKKKIERMIYDLEWITDDKKRVESKVFLRDARSLLNIFGENSVDLMITSPPYPGDHEYTKHSKLELIFADFVRSINEFRIIKQRMLRGSTTNIYKVDSEGALIKDIKPITNVVAKINRRVKDDGGTSGFEKLYTKLVEEYFGGMYKVFQESFKILKPGAKFCLLVSDSHAFKMVHIETARLLQEVAERVGFRNSQIELWQYKTSTSHRYKLLENILTIQKPKGL